MDIIQSSSTSAFTNNQVNLTSADPTVYEVKLVYNPTLNVDIIDGKNPFSFTVYPNPAENDTIQVNFSIPYQADLEYMLSNLDGKIISEGTIEDFMIGNNKMNFSLEDANTKVVLLTFVFDHKFYSSKKIIKK